MVMFCFGELLVLLMALSNITGFADAQIIEHPIDTLAVKGFVAQLNCTVDVTSNIVQWFVREGEADKAITSGEDSSNSSLYRVEGNHEQGEYHLYFPKVTSPLAGLYHCQILFDEVSPHVQLSIINDGPLCSAFPGTTVIAHKTALFNCTVVDGIPPGQSVWTVNNKVVSNSNTSVHTITRSFDRYDNGAILNCGIIHQTLPPPEESGLTCEQPITMDIQFPPIVNITNETESTVVEGEDYFAKCEVQERGNPDVVDKWYWFFPNDTEHNNGTLYLKDVTREANGTYTCVAENTYYDGSTGYGNATVDLNIHYEPLAVIKDDSNGTVIEGQTYTAYCEADANPAAALYWTDPEDDRIANGDKLELIDTKREDGGNYTCHATNVLFTGRSGYGNTTVHLDVQYNPILTTSIHGNASANGEIIEDESIMVHCMVGHSNPSIDVLYWESDLADNTWLNLTDISRQNTGHYTCRANNTFWDESTGSGNTSIFIDVQYSPEIESFNETIFTVEDRDFTITCSVEANPPPNVIWKHVGECLSDDGTLTCTGIQRHQSGQFTCEANNTFWNNITVTTLESFNLDVQYPPTIAVKSEHVCKEDESVTLICEVKDANPMNVDIVWLLKNGSMVSSANITLTEVSRDDAGQYVCNGYNIYYDGEQGSGSDTTILDVQYLPKVFLQSMPMRVREEAPVTLNCTIDSNPPADSHNWTLNGDVISSELIHTIDQTDRSDAGLYNCTAVNTFYDGEKGMGYNTTELVVEYVANVDIDGLETAVVDGTKTTITCTVTDGIPDPHSITLYHVWSNGTENEVDTVENMEGLNNHTFDLQIIRHWNNGSFYCAASTLFHDESVDFGTSTSIQMIVHYKPIITNPPTEVVTRNQGDSVNLKCSVDASPTFNVTWTKGNDELNPGEDSTTLHIANAKESDEGVYKCTAANYLGFDSHEITLTIVAPATPTPSGSQDPDIPLIAGISAGILALLIVIIVLAVMINRQKKPTSKTKNEAEMSVLDQQQTSPVLDAYVNPDNNMNESDGTNEKRNSNMYTEGPMSTFKTGNEENNIGRTEDDDVDDIAALYAQPLGKSSRQGNESKTRNSMPFDAEPGEYDPPAEPPRMYNKDKNVEGITYADLGFAPDSGRGAPGKPPEDTTEYARVDFSKMA